MLLALTFSDTFVSNALHASETSLAVYRSLHINLKKKKTKLQIYKG